MSNPVTKFHRNPLIPFFE